MIKDEIGAEPSTKGENRGGFCSVIKSRPPQRDKGKNFKKKDQVKKPIKEGL